jgi:hypothetical protein
VLWIVVGINDTFSKTIVHVHIFTPFTHQMFQKLCQQTQSVALLTLINKRLHWQLRPDCQDETPDEVFWVSIIY